MSEWKIPHANWHMALAIAIEETQDGDTIVVHNDAERELGEIAKERMCPQKQITFEVRGE